VNSVGCFRALENFWEVAIRSVPAGVSAAVMMGAVVTEVMVVGDHKRRRLAN
jgi:hypothetical protein